MKKIQSNMILTALSSAIFALSSAGYAEDAVMAISVKSRKAEINWKSWESRYEPLHIQADDDDAIVIFRFEQLPKNPQMIGVTSNAAVYIKTDSELIPLSERARRNPMPDIELNRED